MTPRKHHTPEGVFRVPPEWYARVAMIGSSLWPRWTTAADGPCRPRVNL